MKKILLFIIFSFPIGGMGWAAAQTNLIPNPSFEVETHCPIGTGKIYDASPWFQPLNNVAHSTSLSSSSDLYDTCSSAVGSGVGTPLNVMGYQYARTGKGYAGIFVSYDTVNYREYIEVPLDSVLHSGQTYCVSFYVSLADSSAEAISNFGAYFSTDSLLDSRYNGFYGLPLDSVTPQFENPYSNILSDTANWMHVSGSFVAAGGEKFMTIGNFHNVANTHRQSLQCVHPGSTNCLQTFAYYYVDDVSLIICSGEGVEQLTIDNGKLTIYPNPATSIFTVSTTGSKIKQIKVFDVVGSEILKQVQNDKSVTIDLTGYSKGIYFAEIKTEQGITNKKIILQ